MPIILENQQDSKRLLNLSPRFLATSTLKFVRLILLFVLLASTACWVIACKSSRSPASNNSSGGDPSWPSDGISDWGGLTSASEVSDTTVYLTWPYHEKALLYIIFYKNQENEAWQAKEYFPHGQTSIGFNDLSLDTPYYFMAKLVDQNGRYDQNQKVIQIRTSLAPLAPASVMLKNPAASPGYLRTPTFTVRYVKPTETVRLYKDSACTQLVTSGVVEDGKDAIDLTIPSLPAAVGTYTFYANSTNVQGHTSPCSTAFATYQTTSCPSEMYAAIEANDEFGTDAFCVFKTEAKKVTNSLPEPRYADGPMFGISAYNAKAACRNISVDYGSCDLISNHQWMAIAREIEANPANWSDGAVGVGELNYGYTGGGRVAITDPTDPWSDTNSNNWKIKRTFTLKNGDVVWDLAGNVGEWVDWTTGGNTLGLPPNTCPDEGYQELYSVDCADLDPLEYLPANPAGINQGNYTWDTYHIGSFKGNANDDPTLVGAYRGGAFHISYQPGIYTLVFYNPQSTTDRIGFRCVCTLGD